MIMKMLEVKYYPEFNGNRSKDEEEQCYAMVIPLSAKMQGKTITNELINKNISGNKNSKIDYAEMSLEINKKHCPFVYNLVCPLTDEKFDKISIEQLYEMGQFKELYEELSSVVGEFSRLKEGLKKK